MGVVAIPMGWIVAEKVFIGSEAQLNENPVLAELAEINRSPYRGVFQASQDRNNKLNLLGVGLSGPRVVFEQTVKPFYAIFGGQTTTAEFLYYASGSIWSIVVWSFIGLGIARICLIRFTRNERAGLDDAFEYSIDYFGTCLAALSAPIGLAVLFCIPSFFIGLLFGVDFGVFVGGLLWCVVLVCSFLLGLVLLGMMLSWPLVVASVAAEGQNAFDAVTRAFAYVFQRPVHYFFYTVLAIVFGGICWLIVLQFTESVVRLSFWSTEWGANRVSEHRMDDIKGNYNSYSDFFLKSQMTTQFQDTDVPPLGSQPIQTAPDQKSPTLPLSPDSSGVDDLEIANMSVETSAWFSNGKRLVEFWTGFARTGAAAFIHALFWCLASAIYLLLRRDVDQTELDEIYLVDEQRTYDLPPLKSDEYGVPQVQPLPIDEPEA